jgi:hypothetical protein
MGTFLFPHGRAWILDNTQEFAVASMDGGHLALLVFSDSDLATNYAAKSKLPKLNGKLPRVIDGGAALINFFEEVRKQGVTRLIVDHTPCDRAHAIKVDEAIADIKRQFATREFDRGLGCFLGVQSDTSR